MICPECQGSGVVVLWNIRDDSGDGVEICGWCQGYGHIALVEPEVSNDKPLPKVRPNS